MSEDGSVTLAHLSDIHLAPVRGFWPMHWNLKRTLGFANWQRKRKLIHSREALEAIVADAKAQKAGHFLVSGDLVNIGLPAEYESALRWLHTVGPPDRVSVVPGNHDVYVRLLSDPGVLRWASYMHSDERGAALGGVPWPMPEADNADEGLNAWFPYVRCIGPVALIGLNSAEPMPVGSARGRMGTRQLERLAVVLARAKQAGLVRLVMIHHPPLTGLAPRRRALIDTAALEAVLREQGAELVIHGHNHRNMTNALGSIPVIGVASGSAECAHGNEPAGCYNLIRVSGTAAERKVALQVRGFTGGGFEIAPIGSTQILTRGE